MTLFLSGGDREEKKKRKGKGERRNGKKRGGGRRVKKMKGTALANNQTHYSKRCSLGGRSIKLFSS